MIKDDLFNVERLEVHGEQPQVSEGIESEMRDIANYCILMLIARSEKDG